jgi:hypothetical protein
MTTDWKALCELLIDEWDAASGDPDLISFAIAIDRARTALAHPEPVGPTPIPCDETTPMRTVEHDGRSYLVPEQTELVGPTDALPWQWYSYCPEEGIELHQCQELAQKAARETMGEYARHAHSDGWHEDMESVSWGALLPAEKAHVIERIEAEPGSEFDEWVRYELKPVDVDIARYARPAITPIPVSERLPGAEDCDAEGRCWMHGKVEGDWRLISAANPGVPHLRYCFSHWLPFHALPLPGQPAPDA